MRQSQGGTPGRMPDRVRLGRWLCSADVVGEDGSVASWANPDHPGFAYPEAAGIWLAWAAWRRDRGDEAPPPGLPARVASRLAADLAGGRGVGKSGRTYLFDTCIALHGLVRAGAATAPPEALGGALDAIEAFLDRGLPADPPVEDPARWSGTLGPFQMRAAGLLDAAARHGNLPRGASLAARLRTAIRRTGDAVSPGYLHAGCYALEGAAMAGDPDGLREGGARLARLQRDDGGLPAWDDGGGPGRADATAQGIRLWCMAADPHDLAVQRGLAFLAGLQVPSGGLRYQPGSDDLPTWAACFADQAVAWALAAPDGWI